MYWSYLTFTYQINAFNQWVSWHWTFDPPVEGGVLQMSLSQVHTYLDQGGGLHYGIAEIVEVVENGQTFTLPWGTAAGYVGNMTEASVFVDAQGSGVSAIFNVFRNWFGPDPQPPLAKRAMDVHLPESPHDLGEVTIVAIYDPATGKVSHKHAARAVGRGRKVSAEEALETALRLTKRAGLDVTQLKSKISYDIQHARPDYHIDPTTGEFVVVPIPGIARFASE